MNKVRTIIVHCSDSPDSLDIGVQEIRAWHVNDRKWSDIGYHYVVRRSGVVEMGRYENGDSILEGKEIGAHTKGHNSDSIAVCWVGRDKPTGEQRTSMLRLIIRLMQMHSVPVAGVLGHYELNSGKTCPNLNMKDIRAALVAMTV